MVICLGRLDQELIEEKPDMKTKWTALKAKYKRVLPAEHRQNVLALTNFKLEEGMTISTAWVTINKLRRKIINSKPEL